MSDHFEATLKLLEDGPDAVDPAAAVAAVEGWEAHLAALAAPGTEEIRADLARLREALGAEDGPDPSEVSALLERLGEATADLAAEADEGKAERLDGLADALLDAADELSADDEDEEEDEEDAAKA